jgi:hypothetical protein
MTIPWDGLIVAGKLDQEPNAWRRNLAKSKFFLISRSEEAGSPAPIACRYRTPVVGVGGLRPVRLGCGLHRAWSGNGTVALSGGTTGRIRCEADYKVNGTGW